MSTHSLIKLITISLLLSLGLTIRLHLQTTSTVTYNTLKSNLSFPIDYKYYDNLNSPQTNYYYGTITKQAYQMAVKLYKLDDYQQCLPSTPYATKDMQSCMMCPKDRPLFNLGTRQCEECRANITAKCNQLFNISAPAVGNSGANTSATGSGSSTVSGSFGTNSVTGTSNSNNTNTPGTVVNTSTYTRPATTPTTTTSGTPSSSSTSTTTSSSPSTTSSTSSTPDSSFVVQWKPKPKVQPKPTQTNATPTTFPTANIDIFEPVPVSQNDSALHQNYTIEYRVVSNQTNQTKTNQTNGTLIAQSKGQKITFSTQQCPALTPYYNPATKTCENCKENEEYVPGQKKCLSIIWVSSPKTKYVILQQPDQLLKANLNIQKSNPQRTVRTCPIDRPLAVNNACMACQGDKIFNFTSQQCQAGCPAGLKFSEQNSKCIEATFLTNSQAPNLLSPLRDFEEFREDQKKQVKSSARFAECPLEKPYSIKSICSACPDSLPYFNIESQTCEICSRNRNYNRYTRKCESDYSSGLEIKRIVPNIF